MNELVSLLQKVASIESKIDTIERFEDWTNGEPLLGTCKILGDIKIISREAKQYLDNLEKSK